MVTQLQVVTEGFVQGVEHLGQPTKTAAEEQAAFLCAGSPEQTAQRESPQGVCLGKKLSKCQST